MYAYNNASQSNLRKLFCYLLQKNANLHRQLLAALSRATEIRRS